MTFFSDKFHLTCLPSPLSDATTSTLSGSPVKGFLTMLHRLLKASRKRKVITSKWDIVWCMSANIQSLSQRIYLWLIKFKRAKRKSCDILKKSVGQDKWYNVVTSSCHLYHLVSSSEGTKSKCNLPSDKLLLLFKMSISTVACI